MHQGCLYGANAFGITIMLPNYVLFAVADFTVIPLHALR